MANYNVDIEVALKGAKRIKDFENNIKNLNKELEKLTAKQKQVGQGNPFNAAGVKKYASGVNEAVGAVERLIDKNQKAIKTTDQLMKKGEEAVRKREMFRQLFRDADTVRGNIAASRRRGMQDRIGAGVSAGAFPLLFGGGPGMALGGALGGVISGKTFGPAAIALQVLGGALDQFAATAAATGQALNPLTADVNAVAEAAGYANTPFQELLVSLENNGSAAEALRLAAELMAITVGTDGVDALRDFGADTLELSSEFQKAMAIMQTAVASLINSTGILQGITGGIERFNLRGQIRGTLKAGGENAERLEKTLGPVSFDTGEREFTAETYALMRKINEEKEKGIKLAAENASLLSASGVIAANNKRIAELDADLTNHRVFTLEKANIMQEAILAKTKKGANAKLIDLERDAKLLDLQNRRNALLDAANEKAARLRDREERKKQRAIERATKAVERELERTDKAFDRASSQLDDIINKHEDKMAFEREYSRLIQEGSTPAAAKQAIELKKQLLELDRQYTKLLDAVDAQILKTEASIADLKAQKGVTTEYEEQVKALDELKKRREELEGKRGKAKGAIEADLAPETGADKIQAEMDRVRGALNDLLDPANQVILAANAIGDAFSESFKGLITGSMSAQQALANLFQRTADHFADMAAEMIAHAIKMRILGIALSFFNPTGGGGGAHRIEGVPASPAVKAGYPGNLNYAEGGYISGPTRALVGEGGESEYIIPESKMRESMARYSRGARGSSVIPDAGASGTSGEGGGTAVAAPIDVRYTVERINSVDYVTADQFQRGMQQAAANGAKQGEQRALTTLRQNTSQRRRIGL